MDSFLNSTLFSLLNSPSETRNHHDNASQDHSFHGSIQQPLPLTSPTIHPLDFIHSFENSVLSSLLNEEWRPTPVEIVDRTLPNAQDFVSSPIDLSDPTATLYPEKDEVTMMYKHSVAETSLLPMNDNKLTDASSDFSMEKTDGASSASESREKKPLMDDGYTKENLKEALRLIRREHQLTSLLSFGKYFIVSENQITPLQAARQYSIPLSTIRSRMRRNAMKIREDGISQGRTDRGEKHPRTRKAYSKNDLVSAISAVREGVLDIGHASTSLLSRTNFHN